MSTENKQFQPTVTEPTVADDLLTVIGAEDEEARQRDMISDAFEQYRAGKINRQQYNELTQTGVYTEHEELRRRQAKEAALDRINDDGRPQRLGHRVVNLLRRK